MLAKLNMAASHSPGGLASDAKTSLANITMNPTAMKLITVIEHTSTPA